MGYKAPVGRFEGRVMADIRCTSPREVSPEAEANGENMEEAGLGEE